MNPSVLPDVKKKKRERHCLELVTRIDLYYWTLFWNFSSI